MTIDDKNILWLDLFDFLSYGNKIKLLQAVNLGESLRENFLTNQIVKEILTAQEFNKMSLCLDEQYLNRHIAEYDKDGVEIITFNNPNYTYTLKEIS